MKTRKFDIRAILRGRLIEVPDLPPVDWEGRKYEPGSDASGHPEMYLRETMLPADEVLSANREWTATGIYQIDVFASIESKLSDAENLADDIKEIFRPGQIVGTGVVLERSFVGQGDESPPWYRIPVRVDYRVHEVGSFD